MADELTPQDIANLFDSEAMEPETPEKVYRELFANPAEDNNTLAFLWLIVRGLKDENIELDWGLEFLMAEAYRRTEGHVPAMNAYAESLLKPKRRRKGGQKR
jgi:hypothetical protein